MCREILTFNILIVFVIPNLSRTNFCIPEILKRTYKAGFWVQNHLLNMCSSAVGSQRFLGNQKAGANCSYYKAFWYQIYFVGFLFGKDGIRAMFACLSCFHRSNLYDDLWHKKEIFEYLVQSLLTKSHNLHLLEMEVMPPNMPFMPHHIDLS